MSCICRGNIMPIELTMLAWTAALCVVLAMPYTFA